MKKVYVAYISSVILDEDINKEIKDFDIEIFDNKKNILKKYNLKENEDDVYKIDNLESWEICKWLVILEREVL